MGIPFITSGWNKRVTAYVSGSYSMNSFDSFSLTGVSAILNKCQAGDLYLVMANFPPKPGENPAFIQQNGAAVNNLAATSLSCTFDNPVTPGNLLVVDIVWYDNSLITEPNEIEVSDSLGNEYIAVNEVHSRIGVSGTYVQMFQSQVAFSGTPTITVSAVTGVVGNCAIAIHEYSGALSFTVSPPAWLPDVVYSQPFTITDPSGNLQDLADAGPLFSGRSWVNRPDWPSTAESSDIFIGDTTQDLDPGPRLNSHLYQQYYIIEIGIRIFQALNDGVSASSPPPFPNTIGDTVLDGTIIWQCQADLAHPFLLWKCLGDGSQIATAYALETGASFAAVTTKAGGLHHVLAGLDGSPCSMSAPTDPPLPIPFAWYIVNEPA